MQERMSNKPVVSDEDFDSYEDIESFPEEDRKHLYSLVWDYGKRAREAEKESVKRSRLLVKGLLSLRKKTLSCKWKLNN